MEVGEIIPFGRLDFSYGLWYTIGRQEEEMKIVACPICGKVEYVAFYWGKDNEPLVDCPEHGVHIALVTPLEVRQV